MPNTSNAVPYACPLAMTLRAISAFPPVRTKCVWQDVSVMRGIPSLMVNVILWQNAKVSDTTLLQRIQQTCFP